MDLIKGYGEGEADDSLMSIPGTIRPRILT